MAFASPLRPGSIALPLQQVRHMGLSIGHFLYGDEIRTQRSIAFAYGCLAFYMLSIINASDKLACFG
jgi:hypothetical protein